MERLTKRDGILVKSIFRSDYAAQNILQALADYEDAEEQGLLLRLPCKVGDTVYRLWFVGDTPYEVREMTIRRLSQVIMMMENDDFGNTVFLTKEEAERRLAEMKGGGVDETD